MNLANRSNARRLANIAPVNTLEKKKKRRKKHTVPIRCGLNERGFDSIERAPRGRFSCTA